MLSNLKNEILSASKHNGIVPGFNIFGFEDAKAVIKAAEELEYPILLMLNKLATEHLSIESWAGLLVPLAKKASVPVGIHLDHSSDFDLIVRAIHSGFTSVMIDGSQYPLEENILKTKEIVKIARCFDVAVEAEIGSVPYDDTPGKIKKITTCPEEAFIFAKETEIDWMAISIGQIHRLIDKKCNVDFDVLREIENKTNIPLVVHGGTGIDETDMINLIKGRVAKINFGTTLRVVFHEELKKNIQKNPNEYNRLTLLEPSQQAVTNEVKKIIKKLKMEDLKSENY